MREIVLDTETTGLSTKDGDRIIEIACIEILDGKVTDNHYQVYINPKRSVGEEATRVHGITTEFLEDKPVFKSIVKDFLDFIKDDTLIIHNADFDMKFLNHELRLLKRPPLSFDRVVDTLAIARKKYPGQSNTLDALCDRLNVDRTQRTKHGALVDVELLAKVYLSLTHKSIAELMGESDKVVLTKGYNKELKVSRNFSIPEEDLANHEEFLQQLKNPLWNN